MKYSKTIWEIEKVLVTVKVSEVPTSEYLTQTSCIMTFAPPYFTSIEVPSNRQPISKVFARIKNSATALTQAEPSGYVFAKVENND